MPSPLPPEITDEIIAYIDDVKSLYNCAVVHRSWTAASLHHLYTDVEIRSLHAYELLVSRVLRSSYTNWRLSGVRTLTFDINDIHRSPQFAWSFPLKLGGHLSNLHRITFRSFLWSDAPHKSAFAVLSSFSSVRELSLDQCHFGSFRLFRRFLVSFPSLSSIQLHQVKWSPSSQSTPAHDFPERRPKLRSLEIGFRDFQDHTALLRWLLRTPTSDSLRDLSISNPQPGHLATGIEYVWRPSQLNFFNAIASSMATLRIPTESTINGGIPIESFTSLRYLSLHAPIAQYGPDWGQTCGILRRVSSPLEQINFDGVPVRAVRWSIMRAIDSESGMDETAVTLRYRATLPFGLFKGYNAKRKGLRTLDLTLAGENLKHLKKVFFSLRRVGPDSEADSEWLRVAQGRFVEDIQDMFPLLLARPVEISVAPEYFPEDQSDILRILTIGTTYG